MQITRAANSSRAGRRQEGCSLFVASCLLGSFTLTVSQRLANWSCVSPAHVFSCVSVQLLHTVTTIRNDLIITCGHQEQQRKLQVTTIQMLINATLLGGRKARKYFTGAIKGVFVSRKLNRPSKHFDGFICR